MRSMPDIVVATPGRMIDHLRNSISVDLDDLAVLILDEADRLLELGFSAEIRELVQQTKFIYYRFFVKILILMIPLFFLFISKNHLVWRSIDELNFKRTDCYGNKTIGTSMS